MGVKFGYTSSKRRKGLVERPESRRIDVQARPTVNKMPEDPKSL